MSSDDRRFASEPVAAAGRKPKSSSKPKKKKQVAIIKDVSPIDESMMSPDEPDIRAMSSSLASSMRNQPNSFARVQPPQLSASVATGVGAIGAAAHGKKAAGGAAAASAREPLLLPSAAIATATQHNTTTASAAATTTATTTTAAAPAPAAAPAFRASGGFAAVTRTLQDIDRPRTFATVPIPTTAAPAVAAASNTTADADSATTPLIAAAPAPAAAAPAPVVAPVQPVQPQPVRTSAQMAADFQAYKSVDDVDDDLDGGQHVLPSLPPPRSAHSIQRDVRSSTSSQRASPPSTVSDHVVLGGPDGGAISPANDSTSAAAGSGGAAATDSLPGATAGGHSHTGTTEKSNAFAYTFNPRFMLIIFTIVNVFTYFDRGAVGVVLNTIESTDVYNLSNFQGGLLGGAYMIGFVVASPACAHLAKLYNPLKMMSGGLFIWCLATLGSGLSGEFYSLLIARMVTGVGEASFLCLAPPFINKFAPENKKSQWLAVFFCAIPIGYALGYMLSGAWLDFHLFATFWQWRVIFIAESILMLPFVLICFFIKGFSYNFNEDDDLTIPGRTPNPNQSAVASPYSLKQDLLTLARNPIYLLIVAGYAAQTFVTGAFGFYGIQYVQRHLGISNSVAGMSFGGVTVVCGFAGTALGGWLLDRIRLKTGDDPALSMQNAMFLIFILSAIAVPCCVLPFVPQFSGPAAFFLFIAAGELMLFGCYSPINSAIIWSVPYRLGPLAVAMSSVGLHVFGDAISAPILGFLLDRTHNDWNLSFFFVAIWLSWTILFFGVGWRLSKKNVPAILEPLIDTGTGTGTGGMDDSSRPDRSTFKVIPVQNLDGAL